MEIAIKDIRVPEGRRALDPVKVAEIAASIKLLGLLAPIGLRALLRHWELVWGGHRLAACQMLGMKTITAIPVDSRAQDQGHEEGTAVDDFIKMTEIAENLHRSDLTTQQRNEHLAMWVALLEKQVPNSDAAQPNSKPGPKPSRAVAVVAKASGLSTKTVKESIKTTKVAPEVKAAADVAGLSQRERLAISRLPEADQLAGVSKQAAINIVADRTEAAAAAAKAKPVTAPSDAVVATADRVAKAKLGADAVKAFRESLPTKAEATKQAIAAGDGVGILGKDGKYHTNATDEQIAVGDAYLRMAGALRAVAALDMTATEAIASVSGQSKPFFPKLLGDVERIIVEFKTEWEKVHGVDPLEVPEFLKRTAS